MVELRLYTSKSDPKTLGKTLVVREVLPIVLKASTNIYTPRIVLATGTGLDLKQVNYAEIPELGRFYFVDDFEQVANELVELSLRVDVLETFKDEILTSEVRYRQTLTQGYFGAVDTPVETKTTFETFVSNEQWPQGESLVLTTIGAGTGE